MLSRKRVVSPVRFARGVRSLISVPLRSSEVRLGKELSTARSVTGLPLRSRVVTSARGARGEMPPVSPALMKGALRLEDRVARSARQMIAAAVTIVPDGFLSLTRCKVRVIISGCPPLRALSALLTSLCGRYHKESLKARAGSLKTS